METTGGTKNVNVRCVRGCQRYYSAPQAWKAISYPQSQIPATKQKSPKPRVTLSAEKPTIPLTRFYFVPEIQVTITQQEHFYVPLKAIWYMLRRGLEAGLNADAPSEGLHVRSSPMSLSSVMWSLTATDTNLPFPHNNNTIMQVTRKQKMFLLACMLLLALK